MHLIIWILVLETQLCNKIFWSLNKKILFLMQLNNVILT